MAMKTLDPLRQLFGQQIGSDAETGAGSARIIEFGLHFGIFGIDANAARNVTASGYGHRVEPVELRHGIERDMTAATHDFRKVGFGISRRISVCLTAELFECQARLVDGACRGMSDVFPENRE